MHIDIKSFYLRLAAQFNRLKDQSGQDLVEYALIIALIAFAAIVGMGDLANGINTAFNEISQTLFQYLG